LTPTWRTDHIGLVYGMRGRDFSHLLLLVAVAIAASALVLLPVDGRAESPAVTLPATTPAPGEAWRTSPFHRATSGATGLPIPCRCRFQEREYRLGEAVCMTTHVGTVIARCDLNQNITTWVPTTDACVVSMVPTSYQSSLAARF
jgi:hypothetical protein